MEITVVCIPQFSTTIFFLAGQPPAGHGLLIHEVSISHTATHQSRLDSSGRVISSSPRPLPESTQHSQKKDIHAPGGIFYFQYAFIQVHCVHFSTYVTATVGIVPAVSAHRTRDITLPHTTVPFDPPLSRALYSYTSHTFPCPHTSHCTRLTHFAAHVQH